MKRETELTQALSDALRITDAAGRDLHGKVVPPLTVAAMHLHLLRMDHPEAGESVRQTLAALDEGMEEVRRLSGMLAPSNVYRLGLQGALRKMVEEQQAFFPGKIQFKFSAGKKSSGYDAMILDIAGDLLRQAVGRRGAKAIRLSLRGCAIRLDVDGTGSVAPPSTVSRALAEHAGFAFQQGSIRGTIVFAVRLNKKTNGILRPSRRRS